MVHIRDTKKLFLMTCIIWAVFLVAVLMAEYPQNKDENIVDTHDSSSAIATISNTQVAEKRCKYISDQDSCNPDFSLVFEDAADDKSTPSNDRYSDLVPLTYDEQNALSSACEEFSVPYPLALAVIENETHFHNEMGDNGNSYGYMQINKKWHVERMKEIGATDLMNAKDNFRTGCSFLGELLGQYKMIDALNMYNHWSTHDNGYGSTVMQYYNQWNQIFN